MIIESVQGFIIMMAYWLKKKGLEKKEEKKKQKTRIKTKNDATGGLRVLYLRG